MGRRRREITVKRAARIVALSGAADDLVVLCRAAERSKPRDGSGCDRMAVVISVQAISESGGEAYAEIQLDMKTGRKLLPTLRALITSELKALRTT